MSRYKLILSYELVTVEETWPKPHGAVSRNKQGWKGVVMVPKAKKRADAGVQVYVIQKFVLWAGTVLQKL